MKAYGGVDIEIHIFLSSEIVGGEWSASRLGRATPGIPWIGGPRSRSGRREDPTGARNPTLGRLVHSQSLYRLSYRGQS
jgi:hypothetical protein